MGNELGKPSQQHWKEEYIDETASGQSSVHASGDEAEGASASNDPLGAGGSAKVGAASGPTGQSADPPDTASANVPATPVAKPSPKPSPEASPLSKPLKRASPNMALSPRSRNAKNMWQQLQSVVGGGGKVKTLRNLFAAQDIPDSTGREAQQKEEAALRAEVAETRRQAIAIEKEEEARIQAEEARLQKEIAAAKQDELERLQQEKLRLEQERIERERKRKEEEFLAAESKRLGKRQRIMEEILMSEQLYTKFLDLIIGEFRDPLTQLVNDKPRCGFSIADVSELFSNVAQIAFVHQEIAKKMGEPGAQLGAVFLQYSDFLKYYSVYINNYENCLAAMGRMKRKKAFIHFLAEKAEERETGGLDLISLLIMPIQRIPRYRMLLAELLKYTQPLEQAGEHLSVGGKKEEDRRRLEGIEADNIAEALTKIEAIALKVNERKRQVEGVQRVLEVQNRISGKKDVIHSLVKPHRCLIREETGMKSNKKLVVVFLFNDLLMVTSKSLRVQSSTQLIKLDCKIFTGKAGVGVELIPHAGEKAKHMVLICVDAPTRDSWFKVLSEATDSAKKMKEDQFKRKYHRTSRLHSKHSKALSTLNSTLKKHPSILEGEEQATPVIAEAVLGGAEAD